MKVSIKQLLLLGVLTISLPLYGNINKKPFLPPEGYTEIMQGFFKGDFGKKMLDIVASESLNTLKKVHSDLASEINNLNSESSSFKEDLNVFNTNCTTLINFIPDYLWYVDMLETAKNLAEARTLSLAIFNKIDAKKTSQIKKEKIDSIDSIDSISYLDPASKKRFKNLLNSKDKALDFFNSSYTFSLFIEVCELLKATINIVEAEI